MYNIIQIWYTYKFILQFYGFYVAISYIYWSLNYTYCFISWFITFFYINEEIKQIEDKKDIENVKKINRNDINFN